MRITGGMVRGRRLLAPKGRSIRPTSDQVREALFQILSVRKDFSWGGCRVLDLFAGSGALGLEALSRGAKRVVFVDRNRSARELVRRNLEACGFREKARIIGADIFRKSGVIELIWQEGPYELVLADPPYSMDLGKAVVAWVAERGILAPEGLMVVEGFRDEEFPALVTPLSSGKGPESAEAVSLQCIDRRRYGQTALWFYRHGLKELPSP